MAEAKGEASSELEIDQEEFLLRKRLPRKLPLRKNDVYITKKTNFQCQLKRCRKLLDTGYTEIYIHGLGAAIDRALNLALRLQTDAANLLDVTVHTSTVQLVDDFEPQGDGGTVESQTRHNSAIHIRVGYKDIPAAPLPNPDEDIALHFEATPGYSGFYGSGASSQQQQQQQQQQSGAQFSQQMMGP